MTSKALRERLEQMFSAEADKIAQKFERARQLKNEALLSDAKAHCDALEKVMREELGE